MSGNPLGKFSNKLDNYSHIGWIPCIAGRLNYNNASSVKALGSKKPARGINARINTTHDGNGGSRILAVTSIHDWQDNEHNILANSPNNKEDEELEKEQDQSQAQNTGEDTDDYKERPGDPMNGKFRIIALGRAESFDEHCLFKIRVAIVSTKYESAFDNTQQLFEKLLQKKRKGRDGKTRGEIFEELDASVNIFGTDLSEHAGNGYYLVEALLHPNGLIVCRYEDSDTGSPVSVGHKTALVRQAYYYLKYIFHHHKHHREPDDCACTVIPIPEDHEAIGQKLVGNLTSSVNQFRRMLDSLGRCGMNHIGVIGYIESLAKSCDRFGLYTDDAYQHQVERLKYVNQSFSAMVTEKSMNRITLFQAVTFALQATTLAILVLGTYCLLKGESADNYALAAGLFVSVLVGGFLTWILKIKTKKRYSPWLFSQPRWQALAALAALVTLVAATIGVAILFFGASRDVFGDQSQAAVTVIQAKFRLEPVETKLHIPQKGGSAIAEPVETSLTLAPVNGTLELRVKHNPVEPIPAEVPAD